MKKSLLLTLLLLVHVCAAWAADKVITGNVIADDDKQPLIGVSVYVSADDLYNPQIEMFARFKTKSSFHKTKRII